MLSNRASAAFDDEKRQTVADLLIEEVEPTGSTYVKSNQLAQNADLSPSQVGRLLKPVAEDLGYHITEWGSTNRATTWYVETDGGSAVEGSA